MKKILITIILISSFILVSQQASAALIGPSCFVTAQIIEIDHKNKRLNIKILEVDGDNDLCPVQKNEVYKAIDNYYATDDYPASFKEGDIIKAGIEPGTSMSPSGAISFLHWSNITNEDGAMISYKRGAATSLQSDSDPISVDSYDKMREDDNFDKTEEESNVIQNDHQDTTFNYHYLIIPILVVVGLLLLWFLRISLAP